MPLCVSYPKSGRTWLRLLLSLYQREMGKNQKVGKVQGLAFRHMGCSYLFKSKEPLRERALDVNQHSQILFLARNPYDVMVSLFHHRSERKGSKDIDLTEWVKQGKGGIRHLIQYYVWWDDLIRQYPNILLITYEELVDNTVGVLTKVLEWLDLPIDKSLAIKVVDECAFEKLQKASLEGVFHNEPLAHRFLPVNKENPNSYKFRKGKINGYKEEMSKEAQVYIAKAIAAAPNPLLGYR